MIRLTSLDNFRGFKKDEVFQFDEPTLIAGSNGSGKTTLLGAIRASMTTDTVDGIWDQQWHKYKASLSHFVIETTFETGAFIFAREDNYEAQTYDAMSYVKSGGYVTEKLSRGEASLKVLGRRLGTAKSPPKGLVVLDEIDSGFDPMVQLMYSKKLLPALVTKYKSFPIVTSHNWLVLENSPFPIFLMDTREYVTIDELRDFFEKRLE